MISHLYRNVQRNLLPKTVLFPAGWEKLRFWQWGLSDFWQSFKWSSCEKQRFKCSENHFGCFIAVEFQEWDLMLPVGCFQWRLCFNSMKCCPLPNKHSPKLPYFKKTLSSVSTKFSEQGEHTLNSS